MHWVHYFKSNKNFWIKIFIFFWILSFFSIFNTNHAYYFGLKSANNTPENIEKIESSLWVSLPVVSFIFDPRDENDVLNSIDKIVEKLWTNRIYHFTISPDMYSTEEVALWAFDEQYNAFFKKVKEKNLHVIFRTMHEMNGWRYPWASNPEWFKYARIHVWNLSREAWLTEENIAFDFSVNHRDMPTNWKPSQSANLIECNLWKKWCRHFEDYYPWDEFVDVIWFTFYNRWKAVWNRKRLSPTEILYDKNRKTYERIQAFNKPIIIDEVATTAVRYDWNYDFDKSRQVYLLESDLKNTRLSQLQEFLVNKPEIIAAIYFNTDYTHGLSFKETWEADWSIINLDEDKVYGWFRDLLLSWEDNVKHFMKWIFNCESISIDWKQFYVSSLCLKEIKIINELIEKNTKNYDEKMEIMAKLQWLNLKSFKVERALSTLTSIYNSYEDENISEN